MNLETDRLILRNLRTSDLDDFYLYRSNPDVCKFQSFDPFTIEDCKEFIEDKKDLKFGTAGERVQVGIEWKENNRLVGDIALRVDKNEPRLVEIGVTLNREYQHKGVAIEAFKRIFEYLFTETETHRIIGISDVENIESHRLVEKLNFRVKANLEKAIGIRK